MAHPPVKAYRGDSDSEFQPDEFDPDVDYHSANGSRSHPKKLGQQTKLSKKNVSKRELSKSELEDIIIHTAINVFPPASRCSQDQLSGYDVFTKAGQLRTAYKHLKERIDGVRNQKKAEKQRIAKTSRATTEEPLPRKDNMKLRIPAKFTGSKKETSTSGPTQDDQLKPLARDSIETIPTAQQIISNKEASPSVKASIQLLSHPKRPKPGDLDSATHRPPKRPRTEGPNIQSSSYATLSIDGKISPKRSRPDIEDTATEQPRKRIRTENPDFQLSDTLLLQQDHLKLKAPGLEYGDIDMRQTKKLLRPEDLQTQSAQSSSSYEGDRSKRPLADEADQPTGRSQKRLRILDRPSEQDQSFEALHQDYSEHSRSPLLNTLSHSPSGSRLRNSTDFTKDEPLLLNENLRSQSVLVNNESPVDCEPLPSGETLSQDEAHRPSKEPYQQTAAPESVQPAEICAACRRNDCSKLKPGEKGARCAWRDCRKGCFSEEYLMTYCGISIQEIQADRKSFGPWYCLECRNKREMMRKDNGVVHHAPFKSNPRFGNRTLDPDEVRHDMNMLGDTIYQYECTMTKPDSRFCPDICRMPFLEIGFIRDEDENPTEPFLIQLRRALSLGDGVLVRDHIREMGMESDGGLYLNLVVNQLVADFMINSESPFEDSTIWMEQFKFVGILPEVADSMLNDYRITMTMRPDTNFIDRQEKRKKDFLIKLNRTMYKILGSNEETTYFHTKIVNQAEKINVELWAYGGANGDRKGKFTIIAPKYKEKIDIFRFMPVRNPDEFRKDMSGHRVLSTYRLGVLEGEQLWVRAKVRALNLATGLSDS